MTDQKRRPNTATLKTRKTRLRRRVWLGVGCLTLACLLVGRLAVATTAEPAPSQVIPVTGGPMGSGKIRLLVALAWEGRDLAPHNLAAISRFRDKFRDVSLLHMLSPAYFTRGGDLAATKHLLREAMRPNDQLVLLLGGWQSLVTAAGAIYRAGPTFWREAPLAEDCQKDCGMDVPLSLYGDHELDKLMATGIAVLASQGFGQPGGLAVEGWMASPQVLDAARRAGLRYDFSAVAPELLAARAKHFPIYDWTRALWTDVTTSSQPFTYSTPSGALTEVPQSLAAVDYLAAKDVEALFGEYAERLRHDPDHDLMFPLVAYQESAMTTLPRLASSLQAVFAYAAAHGVPLAPMTLPDLALTPEADAAPTPTPADLPVAH